MSIELKMLMETVKAQTPTEPFVEKKASALEVLVERKKTEEKNKALHHWGVLRKCIRNTIEAVAESDVRDMVISHGIHHLRKIAHQKRIRKVVFMNSRKKYLSCDGKRFRTFLDDGRKDEEVKPDEPMNRIIYASQTDQFVGWTHEDNEVFLMNNEYEVISQAKNPTKLCLVKYNHNIGELVTVGPGYITNFAFRYGARHLIPRKMTKTDFDENNMFTFMVLEETASRTQKIFLSIANGVVVYNLYEGTMLCHKKDLHERPVTALAFFNPLKYLISGARDGCIKIWNNKWHVVMVFVGHSDRVNALSIYPNAPAFISASTDCTIRVWNLETCDEVDRIKIPDPIDDMETQVDYDIFYTFTNDRIDLWKLQHLYHIHTAINYRVTSIRHTNHPGHPVRSVLICSDNAVRIISPPHGDVITTMMLDPNEILIDAAYAIAEDTLFVVLKNGDIVKYDTSTNPCHIVKRWKSKDEAKACNYLLVYEYVVDITEKGSLSVWNMMKKSISAGAADKLAGEKKAQQSKNMNRTLLLGGRKDGYICVFNWENGSIDFEVEAHGSKGVLNMMANSKADQLISAGKDNVIKVWRLYPFAQEALAPLMSFYCAHTPVQMTAIKTSLCVAFQDHDTATYSIVMYDIKENNRHDHKPDDDHSDQITGLTSCPRLKLYASSSLDGTVRIWNESNVLIRVLKLNTMPYSLGFCTSKGDLLVGIGIHVFKIPHEAYLPKSYRFKMVSMRFITPKPEKPLPFDDDLLNQMSKNDVKRLKNSKSSFKFSNVVDVLTAEEEEEVMREKIIKEKAFAILQERENDLGEVITGDKKPKRKSRSTKRSRDKAFQNYMKMYYNKPRIEEPLEDPFPEDTFKQSMKPEWDDEDDNEWKPEREPTGFFIPEDTKPEDNVPITRDGFIPNSVLVKLLWPAQPPPVSAKEKKYRPPVLNARQLAEIRAYRGSSSSPMGRQETDERVDRVRDFDLDEDEEVPGTPLSGSSRMSSPKKVETPVRSAPPKLIQPSAKKPKRKKIVDFDEDLSVKSAEEEEEEVIQPSNLLGKFQDILQKPPTPQEDKFSGGKTTPGVDKTVQESRSTPDGTSSSESLTKKKEANLKPSKPIHKMVARVPSKRISPPQPKEPPRSPTPPRPVTPIPDFVTQFVGSEWFDKYFPNCNENTFPKPWSCDAFMVMLLRLLKIAEYGYKTAITEAINMLHTQEGLSDINQVGRTLITVLNHHTNPPSCLIEEEKTFIMAALNTMNSLGLKDKDIVTELMVQFLDGDQEVRATVQDIFNSSGVNDPHKFFPKHLDSWNIWNIEEADRKAELRKMAQQWLDRWMTSYKLHIKDTVEKMQKGHNIHGKLSRGQLHKQFSKSSSRRGSYKKQTDETGAGGAEGDSTRAESRAMTVTFDRAPDMSVVDTATYIDCINYYCDIMMEKELDYMRRSASREHDSQEKVVQAKNTVLVLPKLPKKPALVRLGETHTSQCRPHRETLFHVDYRLPPITSRGVHPSPGELNGFVPCINLPMKTVYINPFPSPMDEFDKRFQEPILITLKSSQKYFIPGQSYVPPDPSVPVQ